MLHKTVTAHIPRRLWREILAAHDHDETLANIALATAVLVAAGNVSVSHRPRPAPPPPKPSTCPHCGQAHCRPFILPPDPVVDVDHGYLVTESAVPAEMPADDPWRKSWD